MPWSLSVTGHAPTPEGAANSLAVEEELVAELNAVLSNPKYGANASLLRGTHLVNTKLHVACETPEPAKPARGTKAKAAAE